MILKSVSYYYFVTEQMPFNLYIGLAQTLAGCIGIAARAVDSCL